MRSRVLALWFLFGLHRDAIAEPWNLPQNLSSKNTEITFEVDSTWHRVHGAVKKIEGQLWLHDPKDFRSVGGKIVVPVASFDTGNDDRDAKLRTVMHSEINPNVTFEISSSVSPLCSPESLKESQPCAFQIPGEVTINAVTKKVVLDSAITIVGKNYTISGNTTLNWADFKIDDPSILIAKLHDEVTVHYAVTLNSVR